MEGRAAVLSTAFFESFALAGSSDATTRVHAEIDHAWGILYAQGGIVMAAMLRAAEIVLDRDELALASASATFCRPVPCGPVDVDVSVLRDGRTGAQVNATLRCRGDADPAPNAVATVVFAAAAAGWPELVGVERPVALDRLPDADTLRLGVDTDGRPVSKFFGATDWRLAAVQPSDAMRKLLWFRFDDPPLRSDGTWDPAMLGVPGDALGTAVVATVAAATGPLTSPSLQITMQLAAPARGDWLGIDSWGFHTAGGTASGLAMLWNTDGTFVGSVTQTAALRPWRSPA